MKRSDFPNLTSDEIVFDSDGDFSRFVIFFVEIGYKYGETRYGRRFIEEEDVNRIRRKWRNIILAVVRRMDGGPTSDSGSSSTDSDKDSSFKDGLDAYIDAGHSQQVIHLQVECHRLRFGRNCGEYCEGV
ncbi:unnamed protein product [Lactuca virosa]|uniref:Uncharacterized protein n=1 Tax=Lactuca virosa TaxID=75947 RepID=A0AAU9NNJ9_9ASTR|nr:unnamed protein product [Lactuca virosa]